MLKFEKVSTKFQLQLYRVVGKGDNLSYTYLGNRAQMYDNFTEAKNVADSIVNGIIYKHHIVGEWILPTDECSCDLKSEDFYRNKNAINIFCGFRYVMYAIKITPFTYFE